LRDVAYATKCWPLSALSIESVKNDTLADALRGNAATTATSICLVGGIFGKNLPQRSHEEMLRGGKEGKPEKAAF